VFSSSDNGQGLDRKVGLGPELKPVFGRRRKREAVVMES